MAYVFWQRLKNGSPVEHIESRVAIARRPSYIQKRRQPGHWEGDLMLFAVTDERRSRLLVLDAAA